MSIVPPTEENIARAAELLRQGELIGMPTETVYGIAANAFNPIAVRKTFEIKGRPAENPLIVHVASLEQAQGLATEFPKTAFLLAEAFWPGPLTVVLPKSRTVPDEVTAGLDTVAIRMPAHPVAKRLIELAGVPVSAPSANRFTALSPTSAEMIDDDIAKHLSMILDGGPCEVGIESTVVDLSSGQPIILRPGDVSPEALEGVLGRPVDLTADATVKAPGMYPRHYAPATRVILVDRLSPDQPGLTFGEAQFSQIQMPRNAQEYARKLYDSLDRLDALGIEAIYVESPPRDPEWQAIWDRLTKASTSA